jgi:hypothetical protein
MGCISSHLTALRAGAHLIPARQNGTAVPLPISSPSSVTSRSRTLSTSLRLIPATMHPIPCIWCGCFRCWLLGHHEYACPTFRTLISSSDGLSPPSASFASGNSSHSTPVRPCTLFAIALILFHARYFLTSRNVLHLPMLNLLIQSTLHFDL